MTTKNVVTPRIREYLFQVAEARSSKQIAEELDLPRQSVANALTALKNRGHVICVPVYYQGRKYTGFQLHARPVVDDGKQWERIAAVWNRTLGTRLTGDDVVLAMAIANKITGK